MCLYEKIMKTVFGFITGAMAGAIIGAAASLLIDPKDRTDIKQLAAERWQNAIDEARSEMEKTERDMQMQFNQLKSG